jgi:hypothetical protein
MVTDVTVSTIRKVSQSHKNSQGIRSTRGKGPVRASLWAAVAALRALTFAAGAAAQEWPSYGGDPGGQRFSGATQITPENVGRLASAWIFHTGEHRPAAPKGSSFEDTPILADGKLLVCTPTDRVFALDPLTGRALWAFDPKLSASLKPASDFLCRGVAVWRDTAASPGAECRTRVVLATLDLRVIELDLATGGPCAGFGERGTVQVAPAWPPRYPGAVAFDSPPAVVGDTLVVVSALDDMSEAWPSGSAVRGLDARTGVLRWWFDPSPESPSGALASGGGNVWAPIAADPATGRVFLPTASPTAAFWGGERPGDDKFSSPVVALDGHRRAPLELPDNASRHLGLRRRGATEPRHLAPERPGPARRRRRDENGLRLRAQPRHGASAVSGDGAASPGEQRAGRGGLADAAGRRRRRWCRSILLPMTRGVSRFLTDGCAGGRSKSCAPTGYTRRPRCAAPSSTRSPAAA